MLEEQVHNADEPVIQGIFSMQKLKLSCTGQLLPCHKVYMTFYEINLEKKTYSTPKNRAGKNQAPYI